MIRQIKDEGGIPKEYIRFGFGAEASYSMSWNEHQCFVPQYFTTTPVKSTRIETTIQQSRSSINFYEQQRKEYLVRNLFRYSPIIV